MTVVCNVYDIRGIETEPGQDKECTKAKAPELVFVLKELCFFKDALSAMIVSVLEHKTPE